MTREHKPDSETIGPLAEEFGNHAVLKAIGLAEKYAAMGMEQVAKIFLTTARRVVDSILDSGGTVRIPIKKHLTRLINLRLSRWLW
ncbi:MAG: hypothetical protein ACD_52C00325G0003 [uncultured bacterium]|uniref:Uncharacterized protein n=1 Tax=Candidatus Woesebacteria bacterium RIFCSPHIGHO2_12_FULL_41_24 TaxID=1802510 RepID=A0A1F8AQQ9_9BACT|nr:MAG: hypothetical protein ACD_52C00325G0003 [uncultured bacterium]OGM15103.1 MAG: hypothetical protein A2W15_06380 [Candidatus Woesebacteria bacterium RBG_16_41_13]OGM28660.1 MAG: hypothetical protein A2873_05585 [Candidatus Woesebacteria bacterium RIFCSPHIGHO2_01_FULL_42_80]OGM34446.1 MAG: hypothetical protein A3D84_04515 [Candidatus Woesebacteria bacterium RIFCSPHIGHO2_02_FULL_42_20]OGM54084.1 MAG: hypothetical protein A3E44_02670 [Candidatus Woesebacteria bacterium RIFCSPHIGHO2_12_FULL_41